MKAKQIEACAYPLCTHGNIIKIGEEITWNRSVKGKRYHVDCFIAEKGMAGYNPSKRASNGSEHAETELAPWDIDGVIELDSETENEKKQILRHFLYPVLKVYIQNRQHVYLWGAPGSGKSFVAREIAKELALDFRYVSVNPQSPASLIMGYMDAHGVYRESGLFQMWRDGGVFLFDELDNCSSALLTTINGMLAANDASFPCGPVPKHKDFIFIATGNTTGRGGDWQFPQRQKIDEASIDRLAFINWDYDLALEMYLSAGIVEERTETVVRKRAATQEQKQAWVLWIQSVRTFIRNKANGVKGGIYATPRSSMAGAKDLDYLNSQYFTVADLAERHVFKGADSDTVARIVLNCPLPRI